MLRKVEKNDETRVLSDDSGFPRIGSLKDAGRRRRSGKGCSPESDDATPDSGGAKRKSPLCCGLSLPYQGSNLETSDPESDVLPITP